MGRAAALLALWTARALGLPYSPYATDGATVSTVVQFQIPAFRRLAADAEAGFELGLLCVGTNDVRQPDWMRRRLRRSSVVRSDSCPRAVIGC